MAGDRLGLHQRQCAERDLGSGGARVEHKVRSAPIGTLQRTPCDAMRCDARLQRTACIPYRMQRTTRNDITVPTRAELT